jgi:hypothetical protein
MELKKSKLWMALDDKEPPMTFQEKELYNQIHPAKLAVDIGSTPFLLYLFWQHELLFAILVAFIPSIVASAIIIKYVPLESYRSSRLGHYVGKYMTRAMEGIRFLGLIVMIFGAWFHIWFMFPIGLLIVLLGWLNGFIVKRRVQA